MTVFSILRTPIGGIEIEASSIGVRSVRLAADDRFQVELQNPVQDRPAEAHAEAAKRELLDYFEGKLGAFKAEVDLSWATSFQKTVLGALRTIPFGATLSYAELARLAGRPGAARAVGGALRANRVPILVPCHRVLASGGRLGGWSGPSGWKEMLLAHEGSLRKEMDS